MENKGGVESWCVACHSSPRGCGKLESNPESSLQLHRRLDSLEGGAFLSSGEPPSPTSGSGIPIQKCIQLFVLADGVKSWVAPTLRHASDSSGHQVGGEGGCSEGVVLSICPSLPPRDMAAQVRDAGFFSPTASLDRCAL